MGEFGTVQIRHPGRHMTVQRRFLPIDEGRQIAWQGSRQCHQVGTADIERFSLKQGELFALGSTGRVQATKEGRACPHCQLGNPTNHSRSAPNQGVILEAQCVSWRQHSLLKTDGCLGRNVLRHIAPSASRVRYRQTPSITSRICTQRRCKPRSEGGKSGPTNYRSTSVRSTGVRKWSRLWRSPVSAAHVDYFPA